MKTSSKVHQLLKENDTTSPWLPFFECCLRSVVRDSITYPSQGPWHNLREGLGQFVYSNIGFLPIGSLQEMILTLVWLLTSSANVASAWLQSLTITSLGLRKDDSTLKIAVGSRLGTAICAAHHSWHCGNEMEGCGTHDLSCHHSERRLHSHSAVQHHSCCPYFSQVTIMPWTI